MFCVHYLLLEAYSGLLICAYEVIRDYLYYKTNKDNYIFFGSIVVYGISFYITFTTLLDLFPYLASIIDGFFLTKKRVIVVLGSIVTYSLWLIYGLYAKLYSGVISSGIIIISNFYILLFKKENKEIITCNPPIIKRK